MLEVIALHELTAATILFGMVRLFAFASFFAVFRWAHCNQGIVRSGIALAFGLPVAVRLFYSDILMPEIDQPLLWVGLMAKEIAVGFVLAVLFSIPFWSVIIAGSALSILRFEAADAGEDVGNTPLERLMLLLMIGAFAFTGAAERMMRVIYLSYDAWPIGTFFPDANGLNWLDFAELVSDALLFAVAIILPFLAVLLLVEGLLAFTTRFSKHVILHESMLMRSLSIIIGLALTITALFMHVAGFLNGFYERLGVATLGLVP